jgi:hypothetical protein
MKYFLVFFLLLYLFNINLYSKNNDKYEVKINNQYEDLLIKKLNEYCLRNNKIQLELLKEQGLYFDQDCIIKKEESNMCRILFDEKCENIYYAYAWLSSISSILQVYYYDSEKGEIIDISNLEQYLRIINSEFSSKNNKNLIDILKYYIYIYSKTNNISDKYLTDEQVKIELNNGNNNYCIEKIKEIRKNIKNYVFNLDFIKAINLGKILQYNFFDNFIYEYKWQTKNENGKYSISKNERTIRCKN